MSERVTKAEREAMKARAEATCEGWSLPETSVQYVKDIDRLVAEVELLEADVKYLRSLLRERGPFGTRVVEKKDEVFPK